MYPIYLYESQFYNTKVESLIGLVIPPWYENSKRNWLEQLFDVVWKTQCWRDDPTSTFTLIESTPFLQVLGVLGSSYEWLLYSKPSFSAFSPLFPSHERLIIAFSLIESHRIGTEDVRSVLESKKGRKSRASWFVLCWLIKVRKLLDYSSYDKRMKQWCCH